MTRENSAEILKKSEKFLLSNVYPPEGYRWSPYRMISPSKRHFPGVWNWDSAYHALAMLTIDKELAKEQILGFLQFQTENGLLPDVIWERGDIEDRFSKPPVMADAAWRVYQATADRPFLKTVYSAFSRNAAWWETHRRHGNLFRFGADRDRTASEKEYYSHVGFESGMDDSPRWDSHPDEYWAIDLNCYMVTMYRALAAMAQELGESAAQWAEKKTELITAIERLLWDDEQQTYADRHIPTQCFSTTITPCSLLPLYVGFAPQDRAAAMHRIACSHLLPGMPTVAYDHPAYSTTYWRGPCWLNVAYYAAKGLKNYGFEESANTVRNTILEWVANDADDIHENYDAKTGKGLYASQFSWSCAFVREFILNF